MMVPGRVDDDGLRLHLAQDSLVDQVMGVLAGGRAAVTSARAAAFGRPGSL
jgi:hypothetical protein